MTRRRAERLLQILAAVVELADDFHRNRELGRPAPREQILARIRTIRPATSISSLDVDEPAYLIANEGRRVLGCDRVSVLVRTRRQSTAARPISGVDALDRRARSRSPARTTGRASVAGGEPLWYCDGAADMPERNRAAAASLSRRKPRPRRGDRAAGASRDSDGRATAADHRRAGGRAVSSRPPTTSSCASGSRPSPDTAAVALANALRTRVAAGPRGPRAGQVRWLAEARQLPKTVLALAAVAAASRRWCSFRPISISRPRGELQPAGAARSVRHRRRRGRASCWSITARRCKPGEPLVVLRKPELDLEFRRVAGEMQTAEKKLAAVQAERLANAPADARYAPQRAPADGRRRRAEGAAQGTGRATEDSRSAAGRTGRAQPDRRRRR